MSDSYDVVVIGAGLSGLRAAIELEKFGLKTLIIEKEDRPGGRVKTDEVDGFKLDRGYQVYLDAYPEGKEVLDYDALQLKPYKAGALCFDLHTKFMVSDTTRNKWALPRMALSPVGTFMDKIRMGNLNARLKRSSLEEIFQRPNHKTIDYLKQQRFSDKMIDRFFKPFFAGIFLDKDLQTSSRMFEFVFKMMGEGNATLPAQGMEQIPRYLKSKLKRTEFRFHTEVQEINDHEIVLKDQENIHCEHIIIATTPGKLLPQMASTTQWQNTATYYFAAPESVLKSKVIALNYRKNRLVNNFSVLSDIAPDYAPKGQHLVSVSLNEIPDESVEEASREIKNELAHTFGSSVQGWKFLKNYHIKQAVPLLQDVKDEVPISETRIKEGLYLAGDQFLNGSINGALKSGKLAAQEAVLHFDGEQVKA